MQNITPNPITVYEGLCHPGHDPLPLIKLAMHILSICANSASCEWLFSTFGNILTKLRSRLGHNTMVDLAKLKMHVRDEHMRRGTASRLKRFFGTKPNPDNASDPPPATPAEADRDMDLETTNDPSIRTIPTDINADNDKFQDITQSFIHMVDDDVDIDSILAASSSLVISIKISDLFDFNRRHWIANQERSASHSLDEEMELYELLDLDGGRRGRCGCTR